MNNFGKIFFTLTVCFLSSNNHAFAQTRVQQYSSAASGVNKNRDFYESNSPADQQRIAQLQPMQQLAPAPPSDNGAIESPIAFSSGSQSLAPMPLNEPQAWESEFSGNAELDDEYTTCRSFLFTWRFQDCEDLKLDLCDSLVTDRPDFTEASSTVGRGVLQLESGYTYIYDGGGNGNPTHQHAHPELLLRAGLFRDWFELRIGYIASSVITGGVTNSGSEDLYVGAKIGLTPQQGILPEMSVIPQGTVDTGSPSLTNGTSLFGTNLVYSWQLDDRYRLAGSTQFNRALDEVTNDEYTQWAQSVALGKSLSDRFGTYMEWYGFFPDDADTDPVENYLNGGFTYLLTDNLQWDIRAGFGLNDSADDFFTGTGLSIRFR